MENARGAKPKFKCVKNCSYRRQRQSGRATLRQSDTATERQLRIPFAIPFFSTLICICMRTHTHTHAHRDRLTRMANLMAFKCGGVMRCRRGTAQSYLQPAGTCCLPQGATLAQNGRKRITGCSVGFGLRHRWAGTGGSGGVNLITYITIRLAKET